MKLRDYILGIAIWGFISASITFIFCVIASDLFNKDVIGLETWRLYAVLLVSQMLCLAMLIKLNK